MPALPAGGRGRRRAVRRTDRTRASDRGAVTVEAALALAGLVLVTTLAVGAVAAVGASVRCTDAARELARLAARGEPDRGRAVAARLAPSGAQVVLTIRGDEATAEVTAAPVAALPLHIAGRAVAVLEPGAATSAGITGPATATPADIVGAPP
jgi:Flp pilus assembly protein TadG